MIVVYNFNDSTRTENLHCHNTKTNMIVNISLALLDSLLDCSMMGLQFGYS